MSALRILVAEADLELRRHIVDVLGSDSEVDVVGVVDDGKEAIAMATRLRPHAILIGPRLRTLDPLLATREIMIECPTPILLVSGGKHAGDVDLALRALRSGALSVIPVPPPDHAQCDKQRSDFIGTIKALSQVKLVRRWRDRERKPDPPITPEQRPSGHGQADIVAIASSTGGPAVLETILLRLPKSFPAPILIVQHIAEGFVEGIASWLSQSTCFAVKVARHGELLMPGIAYLAPDDRHLGVARTKHVQLSDGPPISGFRPSANYLFDSVARTFGRNALAVILTGMGRDGVDGLRSIREKGGQIIAQDQASSVVFGMPCAAIREGLADHILPAHGISQLLQSAIQGDSESEQ